ncbi:MAG: tetratricopeptide repeat protein [Spirochaetaceae bacterium]
MARLTVFSVLFCLGAAGLFAQAPGEVREGSWVFVLSEPIGASISLNGVPQESRTPALFFLPVGQHDIVLRKLGYGDGRADLTIGSGEPTTLFWDLSQGSIALSFPEESEVLVADAPEDIRGRYISLPDGEYILGRDGDLVGVDPVYPRRRLLETARTAAVVSAVAAGILSLDYVVRGEGPIYEQPLLMTSYVGTLTATSLAVGFTVRRSRYRAETAVRLEPVGNLTAAAEQEMELAATQLAAGDLRQALTGYIEVIEGYPESQVVSEALFRIGRIYTLTGRIQTAIVTLERTIEMYPHPAIFDRACKSLADLLFSEERYEESLAYLDRMLFVDPLYSREEIEEYKGVIRRAMATTGATDSARASS